MVNTEYLQAEYSTEDTCLLAVILRMVSFMFALSVAHSCKRSIHFAAGI